MLLIVWHSRTGASRILAEAAASAATGAGALAGAGAVAEGGQCRLVPAERILPGDLLSAGGYLFICPENLGALSGMMKEMLDRCYYPLLGRIEGRPYASIITAGSDGHGAQAQLDRIVTGWRLRRVMEPVIVNLSAQSQAEILAAKDPPAQARRQAAEMAQALAEGIALGIF